MAKAAKRIVKILLALLSIITFVLALFLLQQNHHLHRLLKDQQNTLTATTNEMNTLSDSTTSLNNSLKDAEGAQLTLKQTQAASTSLALTELQHSILEGQSKAILLNNFMSVRILASAINSSAINNDVNQLETALNNLPSIDPENGITLLHTLQGSLANLSFITSLPASDNQPTATTNQHGFTQAMQTIWQELKSLIIVRSDNTIGAQLVSQSARFDAVRQINLLLQEAEWQILTQQDPSATLTQLKINISAYTQNDQNQATWLTQLNQLINSNSYYTTTQVQQVLTAINNLQQALNLQ